MPGRDTPRILGGAIRGAGRAVRLSSEDTEGGPATYRPRDTAGTPLRRQTGAINRADWM